ncbi:MAG: flagellar filament capping protein FliD [Desulfobacteraceae bacterium]|jgi:flagellar hook-associated protein 2
MSISATSGLISGIDYESIINATIEVEKQPIYNLQAKQSDYEAKISSYGSITSVLATLQETMETLSDPTEFISYSATTSDSDILKVSADDDANTGSYSITVKNIAKTEIINSYDGFTSTDEKIGTGTLSIGTGDNESTEITIDSTNNTLEGIAEAINESDSGVSATIIQLSDNKYALSLTADSTGESINFSIKEDGDGSTSDTNGLSRLYSDPENQSMDISQAAEKASFTFNGLDIERSENTIDDLINGVTFTLVKTDEDEEESSVTVEVKKQYSGMESALQAFVDAYNNMISVFGEEQYFDSDSGDSGTLFGDYSATIIKNGVVNLLKTTVDGVSDSVNSLSALGIELTDDGTLDFDLDTFSDIIEDNEEDIVSFFTSDDEGNEGLAVKLYDYLESYTQSGGILESRTDSYQESIDKLDDEIESKQLLIDKREERLWDYYNTLESKLAELESLKTAVESMIDTVSTINS